MRNYSQYITYTVTLNRLAREAMCILLLEFHVLLLELTSKYTNVISCLYQRLECRQNHQRWLTKKLTDKSKLSNKWFVNTENINVVLLLYYKLYDEQKTHGQSLRYRQQIDDFPNGQNKTILLFVRNIKSNVDRILVGSNTNQSKHQ